MILFTICINITRHAPGIKPYHPVLFVFFGIRPVRGKGIDLLDIWPETGIRKGPDILSNKQHAHILQKAYKSSAYDKR